MKKTKNKFAKVAAISGMCALGSLSAHALGLDVDLHANPQQGIGASVDADVGLARANVGANVDMRGVDADVGADVIGVGANTAAHVGFDGVTARANTYAWNVADVGVNAGATWKDGVYVGGTAKVFEPANTARVALQNGQSLYVPNQQPPAGYAWVYGSNGRVVGYKRVPHAQYVVQAPVQYVQQPAVEYVQQAPATYTVAEQPVRVVRRIVRTVPAETTEVAFSQERAEQTLNSSTYQKNDFYQFNDPANGYRLTDKRQVTRRVIKRTIYVNER